MNTIEVSFSYPLAINITLFIGLFFVAQVYSSAPKLAWSDFLRVLKVFMLGNSQERESDIQTAFDILDQGRKGVFGRTVSISDGLISPDELRAFLSILTDEVSSDRPKIRFILS